MLVEPQPLRVLLPKGWKDCVKLAVLYAISLPQGLPRFIGYYAIVYARARAGDSINARIPLSAENDRLHQAPTTLLLRLLASLSNRSIGLLVFNLSQC